MMEFEKQISEVETHLIDVVGRRRDLDQDKVGELVKSIGRGRRAEQLRASEGLEIMR
jgi:hypothetical protein